VIYVGTVLSAYRVESENLKGDTDMAITKKHKRELEGILSGLVRAQHLLRLPDTRVCRKTSMMSTDVYQDMHGNKYMPINIEIGSDLAMLHTSIAKLESIINEG
jgi:hypothetical protein